MTENNAVAPAVQVRYAGLIRDENGRPLFDLPLRDYPPEVRAAFLEQMTPEERKEFADDTGN